MMQPHDILRDEQSDLQDLPECPHCDCALTVAHVLLERITTITW